MNKFSLKLTFIATLTLLFCTNAWATPFGLNITIPDGNSGSGSGWYSGREDNEVEPGMIRGQQWDLEGFFMRDNTLSIVGGYDFKDGVAGNWRSGSDRVWTGGDLFVSTGSKPVYGDINKRRNGTQTVNNRYGYDYVFDIDYSDMSYDLYRIDGTADVITPWYRENEGSSPWLYASGGQLLEEDGSLYFEEGVDVQGLFRGNTHYLMQFDLNYLLQMAGIDEGVYFHYTMECGNDNLMGYYNAPVPEPATMLLLGTGLIGIAGIGRKRFKK